MIKTKFIHNWGSIDGIYPFMYAQIYVIRLLLMLTELNVS